MPPTVCASPRTRTRSRPSVNATPREPEPARLVKKVHNSVYQINPMLAGHTSPEDPLAAVQAIPKANPLDTKNYMANYHKAVTDHQDQLTEQRKKRAATAATKKATAAKRHESLHAVS